MCNVISGKQWRRLAGAALVVVSIAAPRHALADSTPWGPTDSYRAMLGLMVALSSQQIAAANREQHASTAHDDAKAQSRQN
jgi:hypothetical protein